MEKWGKRQNFEDFWQKFYFISIFEADFGAPCEYYKSVTKFLEISITPIIFIKKGTPTPSYKYTAWVYLDIMGKSIFRQ